MQSKSIILTKQKTIPAQLFIHNAYNRLSLRTFKAFKCIFRILSWAVSWYAVILFKDNFFIAFSIGIIHMFTHVMIAFNIMHEEELIPNFFLLDRAVLYPPESVLYSLAGNKYPLVLDK